MKPYYEEDGITIYHGNCLDILPCVATCETVITDPPYAVPTVVAQGRSVTRNVGDLSIIEAGLGLFLSAAAARLSPAGRMFVFCDGVSYPSVFRSMYGLMSLALLVWDKGQIGMGREFRKSHELIAHGWREETPVFGDGVGRPDILRCAPVPPTERAHPAQKPTPLLAALMAVCGSGPVLDPFMGSGSTLVAAQKVGRRAIGVEIEEKYCEIAAERLRQRSLFAAS